ncbi:IS66 family insertion sequence element accessory protein TnpB [Bradyrhizobium sp. BR 1432]|uniref:IS66 family insertion sequence element accessory protein TnpB n=1 Tax=Bradyrhizobium sp. BR 1432 TaxID=3447966 RepID=UPI003EE60547
MLGDRDCHWQGRRARRRGCRRTRLQLLASHRVIQSISPRYQWPSRAGARCRLSPLDGRVYVFRAKRADRGKIVWCDGSGVCFYLKRLEKAWFCWPPIGHHRMQLNLRS